jgi:hypothetical protein
MNIGVDWNQRTTKHGAIMLIATIISFVFTCAGEYDKSAGVMTLAGTVVGALGLAVKD